MKNIFFTFRWYHLWALKFYILLVAMKSKQEFSGTNEIYEVNKYILKNRWNSIKICFESVDT